MFKEKAARLLKKNSEAISASGASAFTTEELEKLGVHPAFIKYLWAEGILLNNGQGEAGKRFGRDDILATLKKAAVFNLNFLFNPVFLLKKQLFPAVDGVSKGKIDDLRNRVYYYRYYIDILDRLQSSGKLVESGYDETMEKIGKKLLAANFKPIITDGIDALSHFFNFGDEHALLDLECMKLFLLSRGLKEEYAKLEPKFEGKDQLSVWKIKDILTGDDKSVFDSSLDITREIKPQRPTLPPEVTTPEEPVLPKPSKEYSPPEPRVPGEVFVSPAGHSEAQRPVYRPASRSIEEFMTVPRRKVEFEPVMEPKEEQVAEPEVKPTEAEEIIASLPSIHDDVPSRIFEEEKVERYEFSFPPKFDPKMAEVREKKNLLSLLSEDESIKIIQQVFDGDHSDFFNSMEAIEKCRSLTEAKNLLSIIYANAGLNEKNKYARLLTEKTEKSFKG